MCFGRGHLVGWVGGKGVEDREGVGSEVGLK
jgi:hypothetical protein